MLQCISPPTTCTHQPNVAVCLHPHALQTDGLLHISQISTGFTRSVTDEVQPGQEVEVRVLTVDAERGRFAVSMLPQDGEGGGQGQAQAGERYSGGGRGAAGSGERPRQARAPSAAK